MKKVLARRDMHERGFLTAKYAELEQKRTKETKKVEWDKQDG